jgi:hypothetical protein
MYLMVPVHLTSCPLSGPISGRALYDSAGLRRALNQTLVDTEVVTYWVEGGSYAGSADVVWSMAVPPSDEVIVARPPLTPLAIDAHVVVNVAQLCSVTPTEAIKALQAHLID